MPKTKKTKKARRRGIELTKDAIDRAIQGSSTGCAQAEALKDAGWLRPRVDIGLIRVTDPETGDRFTYATPPRLQASVADFDAGIRPEPMTFDLPKLMHRRPNRKVERVRANGRKASDNSPDVDASPGGKRITRTSTTSPGMRKQDRTFGARNLRFSQEIGHFIPDA